MQRNDIAEQQLLSSENFLSRFPITVNLSPLPPRLSIVELREILSSSACPTSLRLDEYNLSVNDVKLITDTLKTNTLLTELDLDGNHLGIESMKALAELLNFNTSLRKLYLNDIVPTIEEINLLAEALKFNHTIKDFSFAYNYLDIPRLKPIAQVLAINTSLHAVYLDSNNLDMEEVKVLAEALKTNHSLKLLSLEGNYLGEEGTKAIAEAMKINTSLMHLWFEWDRNIDSGLRKMISFQLQNNRDIAELLNANPFVNCQLVNGLLKILNKKNNQLTYTISPFPSLKQLAFAVIYCDALEGNKREATIHIDSDNKVNHTMEMLPEELRQPIQKALTTIDYKKLAKPTNMIEQKENWHRLSFFQPTSTVSSSREIDEAMTVCTISSKLS